MRAACDLAGLKDVRRLEEPVGAALSYGATITETRNVLVFDFGGGTLDVTVMELRPDGRHQVLATGGTPVGGEALNRTIMRAKLLRLFGVDDSVGGKGLAMPARVADLLLSWQTIPQLTLPVNAPIMEMIRSQRVGPAGRRFRALECLITRNYGLPLFEAIEAALKLARRHTARAMWRREAPSPPPGSTKLFNAGSASFASSPSRTSRSTMPAGWPSRPIGFGSTRR